MTLSATTTGVLNEFINYYGKVKFNHNDPAAFEVCESFMSEDVEMDAPDFWCASFVKDGKTYFIAANGEMTSSGRYALKMKM